MEDAQTEPGFLFLTCQAGVERPCKARMEARWPDYRFAFSRPGFLTYKLPGPLPSAGFELENEFARTSGICLGRIEAEDVQTAANELWSQFGDHDFQHIHVWQRDLRPVGEHFEPTPSEGAIEAAKVIAQTRDSSRPRVPVNRVADVEQTVLDCILVEPKQWWIGSHQVRSAPSAWPGGVPPIEIPEDMISRAYLKMHEAIAWSRIPLRSKDWCIEIGSAPGGASQALLEHEQRVIGIDPAKMDPLVAGHPDFHHIQKRGRDVRKRELSQARWLVTDSNVTPQQTLDTVEDIVTHDSVRVRGMLLTLKIPNWKLAAEIPVYLERIRGWGFQYVRPRHLAFNRQEICVAALRNKSMIRFAK